MALDSTETQTSGFSKWLVGNIRRRPWAAILLGLAVVGAFASGMGKLKADFTHRSFFWDDDPFLREFDQFERRFGNDDALVVAVHSPSGVFDLDTATVIAELTTKMWKVPEVIRVDSLSNYNWVHAIEDDIVVEPFFPTELTPAILEARKETALNDEVLPGYLVSKDTKTALIFARIKPGIDRPPNAPEIVTAARALVAEVKRGDHEMYISGGPAINFAFQESAQSDLSMLVPALLGIAALFIALTLRTFGGVILPFIVAFTAILAGLGMGGHLGFTMSTVTTTLPNLMIAIAIADSVHIISAYYQEMGRGKARKDAAEYALAKNLLPTFLTSITTALGFISFLTANLKPISSLGVMAAVGTMIAWITTYLIAGALLFVVPLSRKQRPEKSLASAERFVARAVAFIERRKFSIIGVTVLLSAGAVALALRLEVNSDPLKYFAEGFPTRTANEFIERTTGGARGAEIVVDSGREDGIKDPLFLRKVEALQDWIEAQPRVTRTLSVVDILKSTHRSLNANDQAFYRLADTSEEIGQELFLYTMGLPQGMDLNDRMTIKNDAIRVTALWTIPTSAETMVMVDKIEERGKELGLKVSVTGKTRLYNSTNDYVVNSFIVSLALALGLITLTMCIAFRSLSVGLLSMLPNIVPIVAGGALLELIGQPLDIGTVLVGSVALGIAVDATIHILANYRRNRTEGRSPHQAMRAVFMSTGAALISTTAILVAGFGVFSFGTFMPNVFFGILTASVLVVGLIVDLVFLPALLLTVEGFRRQPATAEAPATAA
jgi:predicted RND superfamily exporter protein